MKGLITLLLTAMIMLPLTGCSQQADQRVVNVYNWGEYIDETVGAEFERQTGIKVNYKTFASNEMLYSTLKSGGASYDVIIPSDYMIGRMIEEDMLERLNFDNIPNFALVDDQYKNPVYDPQNAYSVPYLWGTVGIIYNTTMVSGPIDSWGALFDPKYTGQILMFDNSRDAIGIALKYLGYSFNTTDPGELEEAYDLLVGQKPLVDAYVMDQIFEKMIGGENAIGPYYAGDFLTMYEENPDLALVIPKEGTNLFVDAMCIPKGAKNISEAEAYINFMTSSQISAQNAMEVGYSTPSTAAYELLDDEMKDSEIAYPPADMFSKFEVFNNLPAETRDLYDQLWNRLMAS